MNKSVFAACAVCAALLFCGVSAAEEAAVTALSIDDAVALAAENNISVKRARLSLDLLKTKKNSSWNSVSPSLDVSGSYGRNFVDSSDQYSVTGALSLSLTANLYSSVRAACLNYESGELSYEEALRTVELNVRKAFYGLLYERENIALQRRRLETSLNTYRQNQEKFRNGQISELDMMASRVDYESLKPTVENAEITFENDLATFRQMIGLDPQTQIELSGSLDDVAAGRELALPESSEAAPGVRAAQKAVEIAENALLSQRFSAYGPVITAGWSVGKIRSYGSDEWTDTNAVSVGVKIPLDGWLPWSSGAVNVSEARKNLEDSRLALDEENTSMYVNTGNYLRKITQAGSQIDSLSANVELARQTYELTRTAYNYGKTDLLNLQTASDSLLSAEVSLKSQMYTLISAVLELESLLGLPFGTIGSAAADSE